MSRGVTNVPSNVGDNVMENQTRRPEGTAMHTTKRRLALALGCVLGLVLGLLLLPATALADDYEIDRVNIDATVNTDGSLYVVEERTFDFDGSFNGVYWDIPRGRHEGRSIGIEVVSAQRNKGYDWEDMAQVESASNGNDLVFTISETRNYDGVDIVRVKLFSPSRDQAVTFRITYRVTNGVSAWADVGELYWKFVSDGWDVPSRNVTCNVHLPVPAGETVRPEDNVRAWGHGPLTGDVALTDDGATFTVPRVGTSDFAEARVVFPVSWLSGMTPGSRSILDTVIAEETRWADEANAQRERARRLVGTLFGGGLGMSALCAIVALYSRFKYRQVARRVFDETYWRDVPSADHPAVLGALYNGGDPEPKEFTAALMRLTDAGAIGLDLVTTVSKRGKQKKDYRVTRNDGRADALTDRIDRETDNFLFRYLARRAASLDGITYDTQFPPLYFGRIEKVAEEFPHSYDSNRTDWDFAVTDQYEKRGFKEGVVTGGQVVPTAVGILALLLAVVEFFGSLLVGSPVIGALIAALLIVMAVVLFVVASKNVPLSLEAMEIKAKMEALKRWLKDFTRLKEAVPQDVVLWNRLLVMAVVLGVSKEVIDQLKVVAPHILSDPGLAPSYYWCTSREHGVSSPEKALTSAASAARSASLAEIASSSSSSGGGGGGGFSGGGGGGFGGGGGGGAF